MPILWTEYVLWILAVVNVYKTDLLLIVKHFNTICTTNKNVKWIKETMYYWYL